MNNTNSKTNTLRAGLLMGMLLAVTLIGSLAFYVDAQTNLIQTGAPTGGVTALFGAGTSNSLPVLQVGTTVYPLPLVDHGQLTTANDGTFTNAFSTTFTSAPSVVTTLVNYTGPTNDVVSVTTSNFVYKAGSNAKTVNWIAIQDR